MRKARYYALWTLLPITAALLALVPLLITDDEAGAQSMSVVSVPETLTVSESAISRSAFRSLVTPASSSPVTVTWITRSDSDADTHDATGGGSGDAGRDYTSAAGGSVTA